MAQSGGTQPTPGYEAASKRAEQAKKQEDARRQAEEEAKQEIVERQRTPGYVSSIDQAHARGETVKQDYTARELREIQAAGEAARAREKAKQDFDPIAHRNQLAEEGKVQRGQVVETRFDPQTGTAVSRISDPRQPQPTAEQLKAQALAESRAMRQDDRALERSFVRSVAREARGREFGYTITREDGRATELSGVIFPDTRRRAADVAMELAPDDPRFEGVAKLAGDEIQVTRSYEVNLNEGIPPGQRHYEVNLEDKLGGSQPSPQQPQESRVATEPSTGDPVRDFLNAAQNEAEKFLVPASLAVTDLFGGRKVPRTTYDKEGNIVKEEGKFTPPPSVEDATYESLSSSGTSGLKGGFVLVTPDSIKALGKVGTEISQNPAAAAGSLAVTAATFIPMSATKVGSTVITKVGKAAAGAAKSAKGALEGSKTARKLEAELAVGIANVKEGRPFIDYSRTKTLQAVKEEFAAADRFRQETQLPIFPEFDVKLAKVSKVRPGEAVPEGGIDPRTGRRSPFTVEEETETSVVTSRPMERPVTTAEITEPKPKRAQRKPAPEITEGTITEPLDVRELNVQGTLSARKQKPFTPKGQDPLTTGRDMAAQASERTAALSKVQPELSEARTMRTETDPVQRQLAREFDEFNRVAGGGDLTVKRAAPRRKVNVAEDLGLATREEQAAESVQRGDFLSAFGDEMRPGKAALEPKKEVIDLRTRQEQSNEFVEWGDFLSAFGDEVRAGTAAKKAVKEIGIDLQSRSEQSNAFVKAGEFLSVFGEGVSTSKPKPKTLPEALGADLLARNVEQSEGQIKAQTFEPKKTKRQFQDRDEVRPPSESIEQPSSTGQTTVLEKPKTVKPKPKTRQEKAKEKADEATAETVAKRLGIKPDKARAIVIAESMKDKPTISLKDKPSVRKPTRQDIMMRQVGNELGFKQLDKQKEQSRPTSKDVLRIRTQAASSQSVTSRQTTVQRISQGQRSAQAQQFRQDTIRQQRFAPSGSQIRKPIEASKFRFDQSSKLKVRTGVPKIPDLDIKFKLPKINPREGPTKVAKLDVVNPLTPRLSIFVSPKKESEEKKKLKKNILDFSSLGNLSGKKKKKGSKLGGGLF